MRALISSTVGSWLPGWPRNSVGFAPQIASFTSSSICPALSSTVSVALTPGYSAASRTASSGKGQSVIGRTRPTLTPSSFSSSIAARQMREIVP